MNARIKPVAVARAVVTRAAGGPSEVYYSAEKVPFWRVRQRRKLKKHLAFMKREDG